MPQVSQNKLDKESEEKILSTLHLILANISHAQDMQTFLFSFLTPTEQLMLAKRLAAIILIEEGNTDSEVATSLHTTRMTVGKLRYLVEARPESFEITNKILQNETIRKAVKEAFSELGGYMARAIGGRVKSTIL